MGNRRVSLHILTFVSMCNLKTTAEDCVYEKLENYCKDCVHVQLENQPQRLCICIHVKLENVFANQFISLRVNC